MKVNTLVLLLAASTSASAFVVPQQPTTTTTSTRLFDAKDVSALTKDLTTIFSSEDIDKILPHRYPFALVDKVIEYEAGKVRLSLLPMTGVLRPAIPVSLDLALSLLWWTPNIHTPTHRKQ
jgi:hypothetical protein